MNLALNSNETAAPEFVSACNQYLTSLAPKFIGLTSEEAYELSEKIGVSIVIGSEFLKEDGTITIVWPMVLVYGSHLELVSRTFPDSTTSKLSVEEFAHKKQLIVSARPSVPNTGEISQ